MTPSDVRSAVALAVGVVALCGCPRASNDLAAFGGGFDPTRYDAGPLAPADDALGRPLRLSVPPFYSSSIAADAAHDLEGFLAQEIGVQVEVRAPKAYDTAAIVDALSSGEIDLAELSPYQFALLDERNLVVPVAAMVAHGASTYGSYLVVRQGSHIRSVDDIKGKRVGFVDPLSTSGYLFPALFLREHGIDIDKDVQASFTGSHPASVEAVRTGTVDVAAVASDLLIGNAGLAGPLVVVAKAGRMPYDIIVARKDLDARVLQRARAALLHLSIHDERGRAALRAFSSCDGFMPVPPGHYDGIKAAVKRMVAGAPATPPPGP